MRSFGRVMVAGAVALVTVTAAALAMALTSPASRESAEVPAGARLPDLDPVAPSRLTVEPTGSPGSDRWRLGFRSATENTGAGPLTVNAGRTVQSDATMTADQVVRVAGGRRFVRRGVGMLRFVRSPGHRHWHYLRFMRYELRTAKGFRLVAPDRKTGFCLGDRYDTRRPFSAKPAEPQFVGDCDSNPRALTVREGISVGYGDDYAAHLEGQHVEVTGLPAGRYLLVHRANADGALVERTRTNNASSALISLRWAAEGRRRPIVRTLAACPRSERCGLRSGR